MTSTSKPARPPEEAQLSVPNPPAKEQGFIEKTRRRLAAAGLSGYLHAAPLAATAVVALAPNVAEALPAFAQKLGLATKDQAKAAIGSRSDKVALDWLAAIIAAWDTKVDRNSLGAQKRWNEGDGAPFLPGGKYADCRTAPPPPGKTKTPIRPVVAPPPDPQPPRTPRQPRTPAVTSVPDGGQMDGGITGTTEGADNGSGQTPWGWIMATAAGLWGALQLRGKKSAERINRKIRNRAEQENAASASHPDDEPPRS